MLFNYSFCRKDLAIFFLEDNLECRKQTKYEFEMINYNLMKQMHTNLSLTKSIILCEADIDFIYSNVCMLHLMYIQM